VESRAYPLIRYNPDKGITAEECFDLEGNPSMETDWPTYTLEYTDEKGAKGKMTLPMTFADFAVTEARFRKQFRTAPRDTWNDSMIPLADLLNLEPAEREGKFPFIWAVDKKNRLIRVIPAAPLVKAAEDRRNFWRMLKALSGVRVEVDAKQIEDRVRAELAQTLAARLLEIAGDGSAIAGLTLPTGNMDAPLVNGGPSPVPTGGNGHVAPWIDSTLCTSCDECININPKLFAYDDKKHAYIKDPRGGPYKDLVRAAEKCTAQVIHPGTPANSSEKDLAKLIARAEKYN
jgi:pyruvate-ferredoxin/flavodoxin oxidoreductase